MFSNCLSKIMQSHIGCICLIFSNVSSNGLPASMHIHTDCICWFFSTVCLLKLCGSGHAKAHWLQLFPFLLCVFKCFFKPLAVCSLDVFSKWLLRRMHYHSNCTCWAVFLMCQLAWRGGCEVTLTTFVFSLLWALNVPSNCSYHCECVKCALKLLAWKDATPHRLQSVDLSPQCIFSTCILKTTVQEDVLSQ